MWWKISTDAVTEFRFGQDKNESERSENPGETSRLLKCARRKYHEAMQDNDEYECFRRPEVDAPQENSPCGRKPPRRAEEHHDGPGDRKRREAGQREETKRIKNAIAVLGHLQDIKFVEHRT